jgi:hypothetical protein
VGDPEIETRIEQYEMAFRMQTSVPELMDLSKEPAETLELYGAKPGEASFANNCLLARRLVERGVRFVKLIHRDWDHHGGLPDGIRTQAKLTDQAERGPDPGLEAARACWMTPWWCGAASSEGPATARASCARRASGATIIRAVTRSGWPVAASRAGFTYGETDELAYNIVRRRGAHP